MELSFDGSGIGVCSDDAVEVFSSVFVAEAVRLSVVSDCWEALGMSIRDYVLVVSAGGDWHWFTALFLSTEYCVQRGIWM
jgi:hypothetical protein